MKKLTSLLFLIKMLQPSEYLVMKSLYIIFKGQYQCLITKAKSLLLQSLMRCMRNANFLLGMLQLMSLVAMIYCTIASVACKWWYRSMNIYIKLIMWYSPSCVYYHFTWLCITAVVTWCITMLYSSVYLGYTTSM